MPLTQAVNFSCACLLYNNNHDPEALQDWEMPSEASNKRLNCLACSCGINLNYSFLKTGTGLPVLKGHEILSKGDSL